MNYWLYAGISAVGLIVVTAKPSLIVKTGLVKAEDLTKRNIHILQTFFIAFSIIMVVVALSTPADIVIKRQLNTADTKRNDITQFIAKVEEAEGPVEISHRMLIEGLNELDKIDSKYEYINALKTKIKRLFDAEALHCKRAYDKIAEVKKSVDSSNIDEQSKIKFTAIIETTLEAYSIRQNALMTAANSIDSLQNDSNSIPSSLIKKAMVEVKKSKMKSQEAAAMLAALCSELGISPAQK